MGGFSSSLLIHSVLIGAVFFWPSSPPVQLDRPLMQISLTMGAPGGNKLPSPVLGPQGRPAPSQAVSKPAPAPEPTPAPVAVAEIAKVEPKPEPARPVTPPPPEAIPLAQKKVPDPPKPEPAKEAVKPAPPKEAPKPKDPPKEAPKETPKETPKDAPKAPAKEAPKDAKPATPAVDPLKAALADAAKQAGSSRTSNAKTPGQSIAGALADLEKKAKDGIGGGGGEGDGPGGGGIYDVYAGMVILAVRPNWSMPTYSRDNLVALVRVKIDPQGRVIDSSIERSSGRADFDASAVNAIIRTKVLPPPPTPAQQELVLTFNSLEMAGR